MTGDVKVAGGDNDTNVSFKNCHPFIKAIIQLNDEHVDTAGNLDLTMNLYNLVEYSDNYADTTVLCIIIKNQYNLKLVTL